MKKPSSSIKLLLPVLLLVVTFFTPSNHGLAAYNAPVPHWYDHGAFTFIPSLPAELPNFIDQVKAGEASSPGGVFVENVLALPVVVQPEKNPMFVSEEDGTITLFQNAVKNGVTGLLAHNYLSGELFFQLQLGQKVFIVGGDGAYKEYVIDNIQRYQKIYSTRKDSPFIDLSSGEEITMGNLFQRMYTGSDRVVFQTCIEKNRDWQWGLIFITAIPVG